MAALPGRGTHVRELFANQNGPGMGIMGGLEGEVKGSSKSYDLGGSKKKKRAPPPPSSGLGQYKPRILSDESASNIPVNHASPDPPVRPPRPSRHKATENHVNGSSVTVDNNNSSTATNNNHVGKPFIIGDKDIPMVLHPTSDTHDLDLHVSDLTLTSDGAPLTLNSAGMPGRGEDSLGTENPLFNMQEEEDDGEEAVMDFGSPDNGVSDSPAVTRDTPYLNGVMHFDEDEDGHDVKEVMDSNEPEGVYIPAPDYDEEEKTMIFDDDDDLAGSSSPRRGQKVFKEYYGEDFSQYLSDDETSPAAAPIRPKRHHHNVLVDRKSKTEAKRPHYKKREGLNHKKDNKKDKSFSGSNSLRDFSFADSKFGTINGVKKRHSMPSMSEDTDEAELFVNTGQSYEQFLRMKNGEEVSDVFAEPTFGQGMIGGHEIPSRYTRPAHSKDTLWKKLTWKFKRQSRRSVDLS